MAFRFRPVFFMVSCLHIALYLPTIEIVQDKRACFLFRLQIYVN